MNIREIPEHELARLREKAKGKGKTAQRARFAITLGKLRKKKK